MTSSDPTEPGKSRSRPSGRASSSQPARLVAAAVCAVHALVAIGWGVFFIQDTISGGAGNLTRALTAAALFLLAAVGLGVLARGWVAGRDWPRTPTMLWMFLLLPVAWSLYDAGRGLIAAAVALSALVGFGAAVATPPVDPLTKDD